MLPTTVGNSMVLEGINSEATTYSGKLHAGKVLIRHTTFFAHLEESVMHEVMHEETRFQQ